ncbi:hypothetical protein PTI98_009586 [Pleurotus ostreatus]|nr:hypothetical protein PTI98_009586 [Pleurotus ostreatus]
MASSAGTKAYFVDIVAKLGYVFSLAASILTLKTTTMVELCPTGTVGCFAA